MNKAELGLNWIEKAKEHKQKKWKISPLEIYSLKEELAKAKAVSQYKMDVW